MPIERPPRSKVPRPKVVKDSVRHKVKDGESWESLEAKYGISKEDIIFANFETSDPDEIN